MGLTSATLTVPDYKPLPQSSNTTTIGRRVGVDHVARPASILMRDIAILCAALTFVAGVIAGMSLTLWARPIIAGPKTYVALAPTCDVIATERPVVLEARR